MGRRAHVRAPDRRRDPGGYAVWWLNNLTHVKGEWAGQSLRLRPWQEQVVRQLFGTVRPDGTRQYRTCYIEIPRKNGKTTLAAALALYLLVGDGEPGAEVYSAAVDLEQASLAFNTAAQMIYQDAELSRVLEVVPSRRRIVYPATGGFYRAIPADAPSAHGYNASGVIYDELHAAPNRDLWDVLTTSMGARRQPLTIVITTAGYDRHSICWELHQYAEKVRDGVIDDPTFLPILYGAPQEADWTDEAVWRAANPALGDFRSLDELRTAYRQASEVPARQQTFRRLYLCQWTESAERWLDLARWDAGSVPVNLTGLAGRRAWGGLDLASTTDLTAFVLVVPDEDAGYAVLPYFWLPREGLRRRAARDRVPYEQWAAEGWLEVTEGEVVDYALIRARIRELATRLRIVEIGYDRWNASQLVTELQQDGATMVPISQGFAGLSAPARTLEQLVLGGRLRHGGHPVLRWCVANTVVEQDAYGNVRPSKRRSTDRIDGVVALLMALDRATRHGGAMSVYERRELVTV